MAFGATPLTSPLAPIVPATCVPWRFKLVYWLSPTKLILFLTSFVEISVVFYYLGETLEVRVIRGYAAVDYADDAAFAGIPRLPDGRGSAEPHAHRNANVT